MIWNKGVKKLDKLKNICKKNKRWLKNTSSYSFSQIEVSRGHKILNQFPFCKVTLLYTLPSRSFKSKCSTKFTRVIVTKRLYEPLEIRSLDLRLKKRKEKSSGAGFSPRESHISQMKLMSLHPSDCNHHFKVWFVTTPLGVCSTTK